MRRNYLPFMWRAHLSFMRLTYPIFMRRTQSSFIRCAELDNKQGFVRVWQFCGVT